MQNRTQGPFLEHSGNLGTLQTLVFVELSSLLQGQWAVGSHLRGTRTVCIHRRGPKTLRKRLKRDLSFISPCVFSALIIRVTCRSPESCSQNECELSCKERRCSFPPLHYFMVRWSREKSKKLTTALSLGIAEKTLLSTSLKKERKWKQLDMRPQNISYTLRLFREENTGRMLPECAYASNFVLHMEYYYKSINKPLDGY